MTLSDIDLSTAYDVTARAVSETDENAVITLQPAPGTPSTTLQFCSASATGYRGETCSGTSAPVYAVEFHGAPTGTMELCGSGYVPIAVFFEDCINVALTTSGSSSSAPVATFAVAQSATNPFTFSFDGSSSHATAPGASIASWSWNFGDGSAAGSGKKVSYTFRGGPALYRHPDRDRYSGDSGHVLGRPGRSALVVRMSPGETNGKISPLT